MNNNHSRCIVETTMHETPNRLGLDREPKSSLDRPPASQRSRSASRARNRAPPDQRWADFGSTLFDLGTLGSRADCHGAQKITKIEFEILAGRLRTFNYPTGYLKYPTQPLSHSSVCSATVHNSLKEGEKKSDCFATLQPMACCLSFSQTTSLHSLFGKQP